MKRKILSAALVCAMCLSLAPPAFAVEQAAEVEAAALFLYERGIMLGDSDGNMQLERGLSRAELATLLTRLHGGAGVNAGVFDWACYFPDVPAWAKPYVGYCVAHLLMNGYSSTQFGPDDPVTPAMACTVVLRCCDYPDGGGSVWSYGTACDYAVRQGLLSASTARAKSITRGEMAVLICRALQSTEGGKPQNRPEPSGTFTITNASWSREDFSQAASPAVFTGVYTRDLYNVFRQALLDVGTDRNTGAGSAYTMVSKADYSAVKRAMGRLDGVYRLETYVPGELGNYYEFPDYFALSAREADGYQAMLECLSPVIARAGSFGTDAERVAYLSDYLCTRVVYDASKAAAMTDIFSTRGGETAGACSAYARAFNLLCQAADIPSFTVSTATHSWNMVYADGAWGHVDVSANDQTGYHAILLAADLPNRKDTAPEATRFLKEVLVPGSTR